MPNASSTGAPPRNAHRAFAGMRSAGFIDASSGTTRSATAFACFGVSRCTFHSSLAFGASTSRSISNARLNDATFAALSLSASARKRPVARAASASEARSITIGSARSACPADDSMNPFQLSIVRASNASSTCSSTQPGERNASRPNTR